MAKTSRSGTSNAQSTTNTYDESRGGYFNVGHLTSSVLLGNRQETDFDLGGRAVAQRTITGGQTYTATASYDVGGRVLTRTYPDGDTQGTAANPLTYDAGGRLIGIPGVIGDIRYNGRGQTQTANYANGVTSTFAYNAARDLDVSVAAPPRCDWEASRPRSGMTRDTYDSNHDINDVTCAVPARRLEVLRGPERRRWPDELKISIVSEALGKGVVVSHVARRHDIVPSQLFAWMKQFRAEAEALAGPGGQPAFAPAVLERATGPANFSAPVVMSRACKR